MTWKVLREKTELNTPYIEKEVLENNKTMGKEDRTDN